MGCRLPRVTYRSSSRKLESRYSDCHWLCRGTVCRGITASMGQSIAIASHRIASHRIASHRGVFIPYSTHLNRLERMLVWLILHCKWVMVNAYSFAAAWWCSACCMFGWKCGSLVGGGWCGCGAPFAECQNFRTTNAIIIHHPHHPPPTTPTINNQYHPHHSTPNHTTPHHSTNNIVERNGWITSHTQPSSQ